MPGLKPGILTSIDDPESSIIVKLRRLRTPNSKLRTQNSELDLSNNRWCLNQRKHAPENLLQFAN